MPELPEVETIANGVHARVQGDRIVEVWLGSHKEPFKTSPARQAKGLEGLLLLSVRRTGKHIVCELGEMPAGPTTSQWIVHLGMTGRLLVTTPDAELAAHTHARLRLQSGKEIRFVDPRRFGRLEFRDLLRSAAFTAAGSEPLTIAPEEFAALFRRRKLAIKAALLNQSLLSGVGNIYADESLFRAGIRPRRQAGRLTRAELDRLHVALQQVLSHAIELGGSSVSDYVDAEGVRGFFQLEHCVYAREDQPCRHCGTPIRKIIVAGRGTHYCPTCQS
ncbi:bifunctional DNA-formamidopyrimidine glycosylase/DNA-(apurinic or apyrimidinic site) lyase [Terracidiphilus gabretensis]|uniref:bifunctional DNA-formamidopyrimidine glycosylase/DNA-(apurinic or apyrimidinic site) lyase n=1 Tax=Terracidiphilus gabretensis TaxID=1577687 RepID=UPI00071BBD5D|nr:bifunctional DNA-formamidopyrimidine glycosylase/DNA-(apurinic or apyrimidinic site) lyase [Terracidiphilus gabretensis]